MNKKVWWILVLAIGLIVAACGDRKSELKEAFGEKMEKGTIATKDTMVPDSFGKFFIKVHQGLRFVKINEMAPVYIWSNDLDYAGQVLAFDDTTSLKSIPIKDHLNKFLPGLTISNEHLLTNYYSCEFEAPVNDNMIQGYVTAQKSGGKIYYAIAKVAQPNWNDHKGKGKEFVESFTFR